MKIVLFAVIALLSFCSSITIAQSDYRGKYSFNYVGITTIPGTTFSDTSDGTVFLTVPVECTYLEIAYLSETGEEIEYIRHYYLGYVTTQNGKKISNSSVRMQDFDSAIYVEVSFPQNRKRFTLYGLFTHFQMAIVGLIDGKITSGSRTEVLEEGRGEVVYWGDVPFATAKETDTQCSTSEINPGFGI